MRSKYLRKELPPLSIYYMNMPPVGNGTIMGRKTLKKSLKIPTVAKVFENQLDQVVKRSFEFVLWFLVAREKRTLVI